MEKDLQQFGTDQDFEPVEITPIPSSDVRVIQPSREMVVDDLDQLVNIFVEKIAGMNADQKRAAFLELKANNPEVAIAFQKRQIAESKALNNNTRIRLEASAESRKINRGVMSVVTDAQAQVALAITPKIKKSA